MTAPTHTIASVRRDLPPVTLKIGHTVYPAHVAGRLLPFPRVWTRVDGVLLDFEFAWKTIAAALNSGRPLRA